MQSILACVLCNFDIGYPKVGTLDIGFGQKCDVYMVTINEKQHLYTIMKNKRPVWKLMQKRR